MDKIIPLIIIVETVILISLVVWIVVREKTAPKIGNKKIEDLLREQDRSSKLLVRRDMELTRANEKLKALDMQKSEFISIIAHQMRTPLSAIKWTLSMLLKSELGSLTVDQQSFLVKAEDNNAYMIALVEDMLFADKLESGKSELNKSDFYLGDVIEAALHDAMPKATQKNIKTNYEPCSRSACTIVADKEKIRSVVQNLIDNAIAYTPAEGVVSVSAEEHEGEVLFQVRDSGIGIPKDKQPFIFNKFFRAPNATRLEANGSGLGLFIVKRIIEAHGGKVGFDSEEGKGTTFHVRIPKK